MIVSELAVNENVVGEHSLASNEAPFNRRFELREFPGGGLQVQLSQRVYAHCVMGGEKYESYAGHLMLGHYEHGDRGALMNWVKSVDAYQCRGVFLLTPETPGHAMRT